MIDKISQEADTFEILVVDDTILNLKLMTDILATQGYHVRSASSGHQALKSVAIKAPDLILLDVRMPEMDGYQVCQHLKSNKQHSGIPIVFISAMTDVADKIKGFKAGGVDYIGKPFEVTEVLARVETHLTLRRLQKQLEERNIMLQQEIIVREQTEEELRKHKAQLEELVEERTAGIRKINEELQHEITERKQAEEAFKNLIYSAPIGIFVAQDGKFKLVNPGFQKTTGYSEIELIGKDSLFLVVPEFKEIVRNKSTQMLLEQSTSPYEYQLIDKNGVIHWVLERVTSTLYGGEEAILGYFMEITERKRAADILNASKARYREILGQTETS
ncbi:MAG: response regulator [Deltaproteobacteria bacterium]|nr:response regulator [Deltaproteobacteria bacterium]MBF0524994.1 response regulator [Deltaproteobacteria bacterium]